jgi:ribosome-binding ATPase YchF (GTP1/OBG family)
MHEEELTQLNAEESLEYLNSLGVKETGLNRLIKKSFEVLGLITFMTTGEQETRAWTIKKGTKAPQAAGKIHGDLEKGFSSAKGAKGAILSAIGAAFEVGITTALGYEAAKSNTGAGDFDVRAGTGIEKVQSLFGIGNILKADFKATTGKDSVESFRKRIL